MRLRAATMFSGIGAPEVARPDWDWRWCAEIEKFPAAVHALRHSQGGRGGNMEVPNLGDVSAPDFCERAMSEGAIDVLIFGSPCQSFSVAGKRLGLDDARGNLALVSGKIAYDLGVGWFTFENVPGLLSSDGGWDFGTLLAAFSGHAAGSVFAPPENGWKNAGIVEPAHAGAYGLAWRVLDAQYAGVPQRRRRVFIVGYLGDWRPAAAVLFEPESLRGDSPPRRKARQGIAPTISARTKGGGGLGSDFEIDGGLIPEIAWALQERDHKGADSDTKEGHLIPVAMNLRGRKDGAVAHALRGEGFDASEDGTGRGTPLVPVAFTCKDYGGDMQTDQTPTLRSMSHSESHANAGGQLAVAFAQNSRDEVRKLGGDGGVAGALGAEPGMKQQTYVADQYAVRRLTPRECERLQGFPDDFTAIEWRGKPVENCPDGPRYKALGNSMAVPVMRWILERIETFEKAAAKRAA